MPGALVVACVLRSGGCYTPKYVNTLRAMVSRHLSVEHSFLCITDFTSGFHQDVWTIPADQRLTGWWSKISLFHLSGPTIYFDLDTIIMGSVDPLAEAVMSSTNTLFMLRPFNLARKYNGWASGVMGWSGDWKWLCDSFDPRVAQTVMYGDQAWISKAVQRRGITPEIVQDHQPGVVSYKWHCSKDGTPDGTRIVCFHGAPRPHQIAGKLSWVRKEWQ